MAALVPIAEYRRLPRQSGSFWAAIEEFRAKTPLEDLEAIEKDIDSPDLR